MGVKQIAQLVLYFMMMWASFWCLSSIDFAKIMLPVETRPAKARLLVILMSLALGFLSSQFILAIMNKLA